MASDSSASRLVGALLSPAPTFRAIGERPTWGVAFLVLYLLGCGTAFLAMQKVDFAAAMRHQLEEQQRISGQKMPPEAVERVEKMAPFGKAIALGSVVVLSPVFLCLVPALFLILNPLGGQIDYPRSLAVSLHAGMPQALAALLSLPVILTRSVITSQEAQGGSLLHSNLAFLASESTGEALRAFLGCFDLFSFWSLALLAVGYHLVAKVSRSTAVVAVVVYWLLTVGLRVGPLLLVGLMKGHS